MITTNGSRCPDIRFSKAKAASVFAILGGILVTAKALMYYDEKSPFTMLIGITATLSGACWYLDTAEKESKRSGHKDDIHKPLISRQHTASNTGSRQFRRRSESDLEMGLISR